MLWNEDDDEVLETIKEPSDPAFKLLLRIKGPKSIRTRLDHKNMKLGFDF